MDKTNLVEIKKGETGTGFLIENDGFISNKVGDNQKLFEDINSGRENGDFYCPKPFVVSAVFQKFGLENANGRIYPESVLKREVERYQKLIQDRAAIGECNHPSESVIDLSRTAINITELHWEGHTLVGRMEIIISEGFRKYGIISCQGDQVANLLLNGIKIGVSSRGLGTVTNKMGTLYVADDYEIICWDVVSSPSTNGAYISTNGTEGLQQYIESKENDETKLIDEKINKFNDWLI
jgi:hypothetical protein